MESSKVTKTGMVRSVGGGLVYRSMGGVGVRYLDKTETGAVRRECKGGNGSIAGHLGQAANSTAFGTGTGWARGARILAWAGTTGSVSFPLIIATLPSHSQPADSALIGGTCMQKRAR